jgi:hypothetical protein
LKLILRASARYSAPGFSHPDGSQAYRFSSDNPAVVQKHFEWMRDYGIDGAWLQQFIVDLPGGPQQDRFASVMPLHYTRNSSLDGLSK